MTSGQDVSEYLDTLGLVKSYFFKFFEKKNEKKSKKKRSWCSDAPEDEVISLFTGFLFFIRKHHDLFGHGRVKCFVQWSTPE